jgi:hypothetical protein
MHSKGDLKYTCMGLEAGELVAAAEEAEDYFRAFSRS